MMSFTSSKLLAFQMASLEIILMKDPKLMEEFQRLEEYYRTNFFVGGEFVDDALDDALDHMRHRIAEKSSLD